MNTNIKRTLAAAAAAMLLPACTALAIEYDLTTTSPISVPGDVGGTGIFANHWEQPAGTGVFDPFLTIEREAAGGNSSYFEQGYNTDGHTALYMDQQRPHWNTLLTLGDLAKVEMDSLLYFCFVLDANEPGGKKSLISVDNVRIYTSATDNTAAVGNDLSKLDDLGDLRWAMNDPTQNADGSFNDEDWVKLDADQENVGYNSNGGSGQADMVLYVPVDAFAGASDTDYLWFYNLNGVKYKVDANKGAEAGYEEWRACLDLAKVPDGGSTVALLGLGLAALGIIGRKRAKTS